VKFNAFQTAYRKPHIVAQAAMAKLLLMKLHEVNQATRQLKVYHTKVIEAKWNSHEIW